MAGYKKSGLAVCLAAVLALAACAGTRNEKAGDSANANAIAPPAKMECMAESGSVDTLLQTVQEALKSGDTARMREALQRSEIHLAKMKDKLAKCKAKMEKEAAAGKPGEGMKCCRKKAETAPVDSGAGNGESDAPPGHVH